MLNASYLPHNLPSKFSLINLLPCLKYIAYGTSNAFGEMALNFSKKGLSLNIIKLLEAVLEH